MTHSSLLFGYLGGVHSKSAVVTGSSGGVGSAVVAELLKQEFYVLGLDKEPPNQFHDNFRHVTTDLSKLGSIKTALKFRRAPVELIVHCAAEQPLGSAGGGLESSLWLKAFSVNVLAVEHLVSELKEDLKSRERSTVIAVGSVHEKVTSRNIAPYSVSKAALSGWVRSASLDLGKWGIVVIGISAGAIDSPKLLEGLSRFPEPEKAWERLVNRLPAGRIVQPQDVAKLCVFLTAPAASHFTGANLSFDSGVSSVLASE